MIRDAKLNDSRYRDLFSPNLSEEERRKQRRNKKERGGSLFSLRKKKDKKDGKGLAKAGSAVSLQGSRTVSGPRMPQHSYSMSSLKRYPGPGHPGPPGNANSGSSQFYLARSESRYVSWSAVYGDNHIGETQTL